MKLKNTKKILVLMLSGMMTFTGVESVAMVNSQITVEAATIKLQDKSFVLRPDWYIENKLKGAKASKVTWKSSNKKVAIVDKKGKITGISKGKATITATYKKKSYKCKITVVDDIGPNDFLSQTKEGEEFSIIETHKNPELVEEFGEVCDLDYGNSYYIVVNWAKEAGAYYLSPYLRGIDIGSTYKDVKNAYGDCFEAVNLADGDCFSGYYSDLETQPEYYVNAAYDDGKYGFRRCFYFDKNDKLVFILTWLAYQYKE